MKMAETGGGGAECSCVWVGEQGANPENLAVLSYLNCSSLLKTAMFSLSFRLFCSFLTRGIGEEGDPFLRSPLHFCQDHWNL